MRKPNAVPLGVGCALVVLAVAGCTNANEDGKKSSPSQQPTPSIATSVAKTVAWPAPPDPLKLTVAAGLKPEVKEFLTHHAHAHLDIFVDGKPFAVPAGIGINITDPDVHRFTDPDGSFAYGGIELCAKPCISPLHTHGADGIVHTESATPEPNTLGQFFAEWGVRLTDSCVGEYCKPKPVAFYVNGTSYTQDPRAITLTDRKEIAIVIGAPPARIPDSADFSHA